MGKNEKPNDHWGKIKVKLGCQPPRKQQFIGLVPMAHLMQWLVWLVLEPWPQVGLVVETFTVIEFVVGKVVQSYSLLTSPT